MHQHAENSVLVIITLDVLERSLCIGYNCCRAFVAVLLCTVVLLASCDAKKKKKQKAEAVAMEGAAFKLDVLVQELKRKGIVDGESFEKLSEMTRAVDDEVRCAASYCFIIPIIITIRVDYWHITSAQCKCTST